MSVKLKFPNHETKHNYIATYYKKITLMLK